jgi:hypothetical protein
VTGVWAISASIDVLVPGLIVKREMDHPDAHQHSFLLNVRRYANTNTFVGRQICSHYLASLFSPYIAHSRESLSGDIRALLTFDSSRTHLSDILNAWATETHILLYLLSLTVPKIQYSNDDHYAARVTSLDTYWYEGRHSERGLS